MKTIVLKSTNGQLFLEVKVDIIADGDAFTIMTIEGRDDSEVKAGIDLKQLPSGIAAMTDYAEANNLLMDIVDIDPDVAIINSVAAVTALSMTTTGAMTGGNDGVWYSQPVVVAGGNGPLTYELTAGSLPSGLTLDANTGYISGMPDTVENPTFTITATDAFGQTDNDATISINIAA